MTNKVRFECWTEPDCEESDDGPIAGITLSTAAGIADMQKRGILSDKAILLYAYEASTYREAMDEHHKRQGWKPYNPPAYACFFASYLCIADSSCCWIAPSRDAWSFLVLTRTNPSFIQKAKLEE